jgi:hypothetical protein
MIRFRRIILAGVMVLAALPIGFGANEAKATFLLQHTFDEPTPTSDERFGYAVAVSNDYALVGAHQDGTNGGNTGQAHLFSTSTGNLLRTFNDPSPAMSDFFGFSVAVSGDNVLIGALNDDTNGNDVGQALLFSATTGGLLQTFNDPTITAGDNFGEAVSVSGDNVLIGAPEDDTNGHDFGQAHLFDAPTGDLLHTFIDPTVNSRGGGFGTSVSVSGNNVLIGEPGDDTNEFNSGQVHLFDAVTGDLLHTFIDTTPGDGDTFGNSVSVSGDNVLIGVRGDNTHGINVGQAFLFDAGTGDLLQIFDDPDPHKSDHFGWSVSVSGDNVVIGARGDDTNGSNVGQAYLFSAGTGDLLQTFDDPTPVGNDIFGAAVSVFGNNVLIGAFGNVVVGQNSVGQAHLFSATAVPDPNRVVDWSLYESWGDRDVILNTKFDAWWNKRWKTLFGYKEGEEDKILYPLSTTKPQPDGVMYSLLIYNLRNKPLFNGVEDEVDGVVGDKWEIAKHFVRFEYPRRKYRATKDPSYDPEKWEFNIARMGFEKKLRKEDPTKFRKQKRTLQSRVGRYMRAAETHLDNVCEGRFP